MAGVIRVRDAEKPLAVANDTPFGLSAGVVTTPFRHAQGMEVPNLLRMFERTRGEALDDNALLLS